MHEARVVLQQHREGHLFLVVLAGEADGAAQLLGLHHEDFGQALLAQYLQVEVVGFLDHHLELGDQRLAIFFLEFGHFPRAEHMALAGRNAPLHVQRELAVTQLHHIAQLVHHLVDDVGGLGGEVVEPGQAGRHPVENACLLLFTEAGERLFQNVQAAQDQPLDGTADMGFEFIGRRAVRNAQRQLGLQQVLYRAAVECFLDTVDIDIAAVVVQVALEQPAKQTGRLVGLQYGVDRCLVQPQPEQPGGATDLRRLVADIGGEPFFRVFLLRDEVGMALGGPVQEALQPLQADGVAVFAFGPAHDRRLTDQLS